jgi:uncharacterized membrane protein HdeD (DUF308 family)
LDDDVRRLLDADSFHARRPRAGVMSEGSEMELGAKFWLTFVAGAIACGIAGIVLFLVVTEAWYRWGFLGMFLFISAILLAIAWLVDRRSKKRYESLDDAT